MINLFTTASILDFFNKSSDPSITKINAKTAYEKMQNEKVIIVDVRTPEEFKAGHIKNAINIDLYTMSGTQPKKLPNKEAAILIYCQSGARSANAAKQLAKLGYTNLFDFGGIMNWPYDVVR